jgi:hypothetical protein
MQYDSEGYWMLPTEISEKNWMFGSGSDESGTGTILVYIRKTVKR